MSDFVLCLPLVVLYVIICPAKSEWQNTETAFESRLGASHCPFSQHGP